MGQAILHRMSSGEAIYHYFNEPWSMNMEFAPPTSESLVEEFGITPYVDWDETEDDDWLAPIRPASRPLSEAEWAQAPSRRLTYDESRKRWVA